MGAPRLPSSSSGRLHESPLQAKDSGPWCDDCTSLGEDACASQPRRRRWQRPALAATAVLMWGGGIAVLQSWGRKAILGRKSGNAGVGKLQDAFFSASAAGVLRAELRGAYPRLQSLDLYDFENIVEPHRETTLTALGGADDSTFEWALYGEDGALEASYAGREASHVFTRVTATYGVVLSERSISGTLVNIHATSAVCKYVRRDTHRMNDEDRRRTLSTMRVMFDVGGHEGRELYGPKYVSFEEINVVHLDRFTQLRCTPWHNATSFITSHQAFSLQIEQSMQTIDPAVSMPYLDLSYEAGLGENWRDSPMFSDDWFGSWGIAENDYRIVDSVFSNVTIPTDCNKPEKNSYCRLTSSFNNNPGRFLSRSDQACGMRTTGAITTCSLLLGVLDQPSYYEVYWTISTNIHKYIHGQLGGMWGCPFELSEAAALAPDSAALQLFLEGDVAMAGSLSTSDFVVKGLIVCPERCDDGTPFEECLCYCPDVHRLLGDGASLYEAALYVLQKGEVLTDDFYGAIESLPGNKTKEALTIWYAGFFCTPGRLSQFASPYGSPNDPLFAPTHTYFDYLLQAKMVIDPAFEMDWDNDRTCWGHEFLAHMPWHDFMDEHNEFYTNQELQRFFRPNNPSLPYVYDDFSFERCKVIEPKS